MKRALSVLMAIVVLAVFAALPAFASEAPSVSADAPQSGSDAPQSGSASGDVSGPPSTQDRSMIVVIMSLILSVAAAMCAGIVYRDRKNDRRN